MSLSCDSAMSAFAGAQGFDREHAVHHGDHPLKRRSYAIPTPAVSDALRKTLTLVDKRICGSLFTSRPRFGKTTAISYISRAMHLYLKGKSHLILSARNRDRAKPGNVYVDVLLALQSPLALRGRDDDRFERAVKAMWLHAMEQHSDHLVIFVDEAQRYAPGELDGLLALTNALQNEYDLRTTSLLWGQPEAKNAVSLASNIGRTDLIGRFAPFSFELRGIRSAGELREVLACLDEQSEFPDGSGQSYVAAFFPKAAANGFRLASIASALWEAFESAAGRDLRDLEIGMEWISLTIELLLTDNTEADHDRWKPSADTLSLAIAGSGFKQALAAIYRRGPSQASQAGK
jgi:hypothetical protein